MKRRILDTNVIINAHGSNSPQTSEACIRLCQKLLFRCTTEEYQIVIDVGKHGSDVLTEYQNNLKFYGGSFGEIFVRWLINNLTDAKHVFEVPIVRGEREGDYDEFPIDPDLKAFDPSDRKFIALGAAHYMYEEDVAPIVQSADYKWKAFVVAFARHHVEIEFLCDTGGDEDHGKIKS